MAKAAAWPVTDAQARKRGEQTGLDTLVVHALNDEEQVSGVVRVGGCTVKSGNERNPRDVLLPLS